MGFHRLAIAELAGGIDNRVHIKYIPGHFRGAVDLHQTRPAPRIHQEIAFQGMPPRLLHLGAQQIVQYLGPAHIRDRNDLNGSPALGRRGVWIGGEHGLMTHVPYDYCLGRGASERRCDTDPGERFAKNLTRTFPVTAGGSTETDGYRRRNVVVCY